MASLMRHFKEGPNAQHDQQQELWQKTCLISGTQHWLASLKTTQICKRMKIECAWPWVRRYNIIRDILIPWRCLRMTWLFILQSLYYVFSHCLSIIAIPKLWLCVYLLLVTLLVVMCFSFSARLISCHFASKSICRYLQISMTLIHTYV